MQNLIGTTIGGCRIDAKIGQGGMGAVFKAHHLALDIPVAVKILQPLMEIPAAEERFLREARIAARLRHPHIIGVHNVGFENGIHFIVMDYIEGKNLQEIIKEQKRIRPEEAVRITGEILSALQVALEHGIVHRDIKPENILIERSGSAKLADLGLARIVGDISVTQSSTVLGSPHYVAPEQAENPGAADHRADIYSLGCTLFHMLSGTAPYGGSSSVEVILSHIKKPVPQVCKLCPDIPVLLSDCVSVMMEKDPAKRYQTPAEACAALNTVISSGNETAVPTRLHAKTKKNVDYRKIALSLVVLILVFTFAIYLVKGTGKEDAPVVYTADSIVAPDTITDSVAEEKESSEPVPKVVPKKAALTKNPETVAEKRAPGADNPVLAAVKIGDTESLKRILDRGVSPNVGRSFPTTPLHEAVRRGMTVNTQLLLDKGATPNVRDKRGDMPLHYALRGNEQFMVTLLLQKGADPNAPDYRGKTPLQIAASIDSELEKMVRKYGGR